MWIGYKDEKKKSIYHIIRRRPYMTTDILTFNTRRADTDEYVNYQALEQIKELKI